VAVHEAFLKLVWKPQCEDMIVWERSAALIIQR